MNLQTKTVEMNDRSAQQTEKVEVPFLNYFFDELTDEHFEARM